MPGNVARFEVSGGETEPKPTQVQTYVAIATREKVTA